MKWLTAWLFSLAMIGCSTPDNVRPDGGTGGIQQDGGTVTKTSVPCVDPLVIQTQGDAQFGPLPGPAGGNLEYQVPVFYKYVSPQLYAIDVVNDVIGMFPGNYYFCWYATPNQWRVNGHQDARGFRGMCGETNMQYATVGLHVVNYGPYGLDAPVDEYWFQTIDPVNGIEQGSWWGGQSYYAWFYSSFLGCVDRNPPYPRT